jgi:hypothetical protein
MELILEIVRQNAFTVRRLGNVGLCFAALMLGTEALQLIAVGAFANAWPTAIILLAHRMLSDVVIGVAGVVLALALRGSGLGTSVPQIKWVLAVVTMVGGGYASLVHCGSIDAALSLVATGIANPPAHIVCIAPVVQWAIVPTLAYWLSSRIIGRQWHARF